MASETNDGDDGDDGDDGIVDEETHDTMRPPCEVVPRFETLPQSTRGAVEALNVDVVEVNYVNTHREEEVVRKICEGTTVKRGDLVTSTMEYNERDKLLFAEYRYGDEIVYVYIDKDYSEPVSVEFDGGLRVAVRQPDAPVLLKVRKKADNTGKTEEVNRWKY